jgi:protease I
MTQTLQGLTIALLATNGFEDSELAQPLEALSDAGASITVISEKAGSIVGKNGTDVPVDKTIDEVELPATFDGLLLPGGVANPDKMRLNEKAVTFVRSFFDEAKPVAAICHAPWLLIEAGVVTGRTLTSWPSLKTDIKNAGGLWLDQETVIDKNLLTSRKPDDLPAFCSEAIALFSR